MRVETNVVDVALEVPVAEVLYQPERGSRRLKLGRFLGTRLSPPSFRLCESEFIGGIVYALVCRRCRTSSNSLLGGPGSSPQWGLWAR